MPPKKKKAQKKGGSGSRGQGSSGSRRQNFSGARPREGPVFFESLGRVQVLFARFVKPIRITLIVHTVLSLAYAFTQDNYHVEGLGSLSIRAAAMAFLIYQMYHLGRNGLYRTLIFAGLIASFIGDMLFMKLDETSFMLAMICYFIMHVIFACAHGFEKLHFPGFAVGTSIAMAWSTFLSRRFLDYQKWAGPVYICTVCASAWRADSSREPEIEDSWTKFCGRLGHLIFVVAHLNFSMHVFYFNWDYDPLHIVTTTLFSAGQMMMAISTYDNNLVFRSH